MRAGLNPPLSFPLPLPLRGRGEVRERKGKGFSGIWERMGTIGNEWERKGLTWSGSRPARIRNTT